VTYGVGLTGGIGSGKSAVADAFSALGVPVVDTDAIAHALTTAEGAAMLPIRQAFGDAVIAADGALDRAAMRALVFSDAAARRHLEAILHPLIREESDRCVASAAADGAAYAILMVPLLIESGTYRERVQRVLVVDCAEATQIRRVMARSGLVQADVERIMQAQATRQQRLAAADDVIDNEGPLDALPERVRQLHEEYLKRAAHAA
jgi:dephospho-CoA kinase